MDVPFDPRAELRPTTANGLPANFPELAANAELCTALRRHTMAIVARPYEPDAWITRATTLDALQYPELAVGDAHKAERLSHSMLTFLGSNAHQPWLLGHNRGFYMLQEGDHEHPDPRESTVRSQAGLVTQQGDLATLESRARQIIAQHIGLTARGEGDFIPQAYPWLTQSHRVRDNSVIEQINHEIRSNKITTETRQPYVEVKRCTFRPEDDLESESSALGVFATCDISSGSTILTEESEFFGCKGSSGNGAKGCSDPHHPNLPGEPASDDLRWVRKSAGSLAPDTLTFCRFLMACVKQNKAREEDNQQPLTPFDLPAIARLTPAYHKQEKRTFRLKQDISIPNDALQQFGIDIFANRDYDTWVLFTIAARINNNAWTNPVCAGLNSLFAVFNHSCEPNVDWGCWRSNHRTIGMAAEKDVKAGEQLFIEYNSFAHDESLAKRRSCLTIWINGDCMCTRCVREEQAEAEEKQPESGERPEWDVGERPAFPEDEYWASVA